jgi:AraC family transcriptional activator of tynA and feaB
MSVAFSTRDLNPRDRIPYWVDVATKAYYGHGFSASIETFAGSLQAGHLNNIVLSRCECGPCDVTRTRLEIAGDDIDDMILAVRLSGRSTFSQNGRDEIIDPGTLFVQDTGRPLRFNFLTHATSICVSIPRNVWQARIGSAVMTGKVSTKQPVAGLAAEFLTMLAARNGTIEGPAKARLADQALDLIALALTAGDGTPALSSPRASALLRLKMAIDTRLSDPNLKPAEAAAAAGISVRYANDLLAEENSSIERYILHRRLERCRSALEDPLQAHRMIGEIAFSWGFSDHSHFTRRFRAAFGMTPGDCRRLLQERRGG